MEYDFSHLEIGRCTATIQREEALLLYAMVKVLNPKTIVEFGFFEGYSARNFLTALPEGGMLYSFDPSGHALEVSRTLHDPRFRFINKEGERIEHSDIDYKVMDMVFIDASHNYFLNVKLFKRIEKFFSKDCLIIIHDTGLYKNEFLKDENKVNGSFYIKKEGYALRPEERLYVNYIKRRYPSYDQINFHSVDVPRYGVTILKKYKKLSLGGRSAWVWFFSLGSLIYSRMAATMSDRSKAVIKKWLKRLSMVR